MNANQLVGYQIGSTNLITIMNNTGTHCMYSGASLKTLLKEYPKMVVMTMRNADKQITVEQEKQFCSTPPKEITEEEYWEALEVLPPCNWKRTREWEYFHISEMYTADIGSCYFRVGKQYYYKQDRVSRKPEILAGIMDNK